MLPAIVDAQWLMAVEKASEPPRPMRESLWRWSNPKPGRCLARDLFT
jgi:hypothetical protein